VGSKSIFAESITAFDASHPSFRVKGSDGNLVSVTAAKDPGRLHFSHKLHMTPGLKPSSEEAKQLGLANVRPLTLGEVQDAKAREAYRTQQAETMAERGQVGTPSDRDLVQLRCVACHLLEAEEIPAASSGRGAMAPARREGSYMLPISYQNHCRPCHPLTFDTALPGKEIPHGLQPEEVHQFLWGAYAGRRAGNAQVNLPPLPGESPSNIEKSLREKLEAKIKAEEAAEYPERAQQAEIYAYRGRTTCGLCHYYDKQAESVVPKRIVPPALVDIWFSHAKFDHRSHRAIGCLECHKDAESSSRSESVMLPDLQICLQCHSSSPPSGQAIQHGPIRSNCTTCHRYHNGDHSAQGLGAKSRSAKRQSNLEQFLAGP
jgi:hypothetical protein